MNKSKIQLKEALQLIARNEHMKSYIQRSSELYPLLLRAAKRFVTGESRKEGIETATELKAKGYHLSLEYIGENTRSLEGSRMAKNEFLNLMKDLNALSMKETISLDLSHIGLSLDPETAFIHLSELAEQANAFDMNLMISMEESAKTDFIFNIYKKAVEQYPNIGITMQANLYRTPKDIEVIKHYPGKIRLVKGAYKEPSEIAMSRSKELDRRYLQLVDELINAGHPLSIATHDEMLLKEMEHRQYFNNPNVEIEMLYGIQSEQLKDLKNKGYKTRVYTTYGKEWYLYLCHRLAEYPENIYTALINIIHPKTTVYRDTY